MNASAAVVPPSPLLAAKLLWIVKRESDLQQDRYLPHPFSSTLPPPGSWEATA